MGRLWLGLRDGLQREGRDGIWDCAFQIGKRQYFGVSGGSNPMDVWQGGGFYFLLWGEPGLRWVVLVGLVVVVFFLWAGGRAAPELNLLRSRHQWPLFDIFGRFAAPSHQRRHAGYPVSRPIPFRPGQALMLCSGFSGRLEPPPFSCWLGHALPPLHGITAENKTNSKHESNRRSSTRRAGRLGLDG